MGFADNLRNNTPSGEQVYQEQLKRIVEIVLDRCKSESEQGVRRYSSYGDRCGIRVDFPDNLSKRQIKDIGKRLTKDIEQRLIKEGFKTPHIEVRKTTSYTGGFWGIEMDVSCSW